LTPPPELDPLNVMLELPPLAVAEPLTEAEAEPPPVFTANALPATYALAANAGLPAPIMSALAARIIKPLIAPSCR
jgi:hypothetical protein